MQFLCPPSPEVDGVLRALLSVLTSTPHVCRYLSSSRTIIHRVIALGPASRRALCPQRVMQGHAVGVTQRRALYGPNGCPQVIDPSQYKASKEGGAKNNHVLYTLSTATRRFVAPCKMERAHGCLPGRRCRPTDLRVRCTRLGQPTTPMAVCAAPTSDAAAPTGALVIAQAVRTILAAPTAAARGAHAGCASATALCGRRILIVKCDPRNARLRRETMASEAEQRGEQHGAVSKATQLQVRSPAYLHRRRCGTCCYFFYHLHPLGASLLKLLNAAASVLRYPQ